ncbi:hypothetical protein C1H46_000532 [Malus baccata]|uniref:Uncharacterized protein n=1 Tax=Malus baccata TaxID=106549 RepID=A0A540NS93_MALBA|nr:hypothetical protein C1H46_000532 [Malus baccata]
MDNVNAHGLPLGPNITDSTPKAKPKSVDVQASCNQIHCRKSTKFPKAAVVADVIALSVTLAGAVFLALIRYRQRKQKIGNASDPSDGRLSTDQARDFYRRSPSPLLSLEYANGWDPLADGRNEIGLSLFIHLGIEESEDIVRNTLKLLVNGANDGGDRALHRPDRRSERPGVLLGVIVQIRNVHQGLNHRHPQKP